MIKSSIRQRLLGSPSKYAFALGSAALLGGALKAAADTIASWNFESLVISSFNSTGGTVASATAASTGGILADVGTGTASGVHASSSTVYSTPQGVGVPSSGPGAGKAFSSNGWSAGDYYGFTINTTSYTDIMVSFDMFRSSTGPSSFSLSYSLDNSSFLTFTTFSVAIGTSTNSTGGTGTASSWNVYNYDLSLLDSLEGQSSVYFRVASASSAATAGTMRIDDFTVTGISAVPEPATSGIAIATAAGALALMARRRRKA